MKREPNTLFSLAPQPQRLRKPPKYATAGLKAPRRSVWILRCAQYDNKKVGMTNLGLIVNYDKEFKGLVYNKGI